MTEEPTLADVLNAWNGGKDTADIARSFHVQESVIYNMLAIGSGAVVVAPEIETRPQVISTANRSRGVLDAWSAAYSALHSLPAPTVTHTGGGYYRMTGNSRPFTLREFDVMTLRFKRRFLARRPILEAAE